MQQVAIASVFHEVRRADPMPTGADRGAGNPAPLSEIHQSACNFRLRSLLNSRRNTDKCSRILFLIHRGCQASCHTFMPCCHILVTCAIVFGIVQGERLIGTCIRCVHAMGGTGLYSPLHGFIIHAETLRSSGIDFAHGSVPACVPRNVAAHTAAAESVRCGIFIS
jgi:hypothetical protein